MRKYFSGLLGLLVLLCSVSVSNAQKEWRNWSSLNFTAGFTKKIDLKLSHLRSHILTDSFSNNFNQSSAQLGFDPNRHLSFDLGVMLTQFPGSGNTTTRTYLRGGYKVNLARVLTWTNSVQGEIHSASETRFNKRVIYITRLSTRKRLPFLKLSPSISYWLFYNIGGNAIQYYDEAGTKTVKQSPNGFHRGRLFVNLNSRVNKFFTVGLYYMNQSEFNLFADETRQINVKNPRTGKVSRAFDNYHVAGLSLAFNLNLYKQ